MPQGSGRPGGFIPAPQAFAGEQAFAPHGGTATMHGGTATMHGGTATMHGGTATATLTAPDWRDTVDPASPGAVWLAQRILFLAEAEAAEITRQASSRAAEIQATAVEEAIEIRRLAAEQATAVREAAEQEAERTRAAVLTLSDELGRLAAHVTDSLTTSRPVTRPRPQREARPSAQPGTEPVAEPATRPAVRPAARPRQFNAMRMVVAAMVAMVAAAATAGTTEVALHGFPFFVFRAAGTGSTPGNGLHEDQGPGQPDAPGAHQQGSAPAGGGHG